jgi:hypothetical protein
VKVAFDQHIPTEAVRAAIRIGCDVVYWAADEHDEMWSREALDRGAEVIVSRDVDLWSYCNTNGLICIVPNGASKGSITQSVMMQLERCLKRRGKGQG